MAKIENGILLEVEESDIVNGTYEIPSDTLIIGPRAFCHNQKLLEIVIPKNIMGIGKAAFLYCDNLIKVTATNNLLVIGEMAFYCCKSLKVFDVNQNITESEENFYLTRSEFIDLFGTYGGKNIEEIEKWQTYYSKNENEVLDGDWFTYKHLEEMYLFYPGIYTSAFEFCKNFNKLVVPNKMTIIGKHALWGIIISSNMDFNFSNIISVMDYCFDIIGPESKKYEAQFYEMIRKNSIRIKNHLDSLNIGSLPNDAKIERIGLKGLVGKLKAKFDKKEVTATEIETEKQVTKPREKAYSIEELEMIIPNTLELLNDNEVIEFKKSFEERYKTLKNGFHNNVSSLTLYVSQAYRADLFKLYNDINKFITLLKVRTIKENIENNMIDSENIYKSIDEIKVILSKLNELKDSLSHDQFDKTNNIIYNVIYNLIKKELELHSKNTLYDSMEDIDKLYLFKEFMNDVKTNYSDYLKEIIEQTHLDINVLNYYLKAYKKKMMSGNRKTRTENIPVNTSLVKLECVPLTKVENGRVLLEEFKTITK